MEERIANLEKKIAALEAQIQELPKITSYVISKLMGWDASKKDNSQHTDKLLNIQHYTVESD